MITQKYNNSESGPMWGLFILSPILSLFFALKNFRYASAKNIVWAFTIFYGFTFVISDEGIDANRYRDSFIEFSRTSITFQQFTQTLYDDEESKSVDVLNPTLQFLISRVTSNPKFLFAAYGLIFGFFYSRNLWYILDRVGSHLKREVVLLIITFALVVPIWDLNGFRFNTSMHLFLFGILPYLFEGKKKGIIISVLSIFVHFSFVFPVIIFLIYLVFGNRLYLYFFFFITTMFISEVNITFIQEKIASTLPEVFKIRTSGYTSDERIEELKDKRESRVQSTNNWYVNFYREGLNWTIYIFLVVILLRGKKFIKDNNGMLKLICFTFFLQGWANLSRLVPSGVRFVTLANLFALGFIILYIQNGPKETILSMLIPISVLLLLVFIIVTIRIGFDTIAVLTILGNPITVLFFEGDVALITLIK